MVGVGVLLGIGVAVAVPAGERVSVGVGPGVVWAQAARPIKINPTNKALLGFISIPRYLGSNNGVLKLK